MTSAKTARIAATFVSEVPFTLEQIESEHIRRVTGANQALEQAAELLDIDPATLYRRRKKLE